MPHKALKLRIFGAVLVGLAAVTALLAAALGFELDVFYFIIAIVGAGLFGYGARQGRTP